MLALVASARDEGLSRERALALLWPELDLQHARNNLKQLVFSVRRALRPDALATVGATTRLDPRVITVDVWDFERALADGALETAVARYGGPFLDGFGVAGLLEFERWADSERERLSRLHSEALASLSERAHRAGQFEAEVAWRRQLAALDPFNTPGALSLVRALADAGDVPGALRHAHLHERLVRSELDADVGPEMREVVDQLRRQREPGSEPAVRSDEIAIPTREDLTPTASPREATSIGPTGPGAAPVPITDSTHRRRVPIGRAGRVAILALAAVNVVLVGFAGRAKFLTPTAAVIRDAAAVPAPVAVFAFDDDRSGDSTRELGQAAAGLLSTSLEGGTWLTVRRAGRRSGELTFSRDSRGADLANAAQRAEQLGARFFIVGRIVETGGRFRVTATLHDRARTNPPLATAVADDASGDFIEIADRLATQLLAGQFVGTRGVLARAAARTTRSLPAAKAYFAAEQDFVSGRYSAAASALHDAVRIDTGFALAYYRMSHVAELLGDDSTMLAAAGAAVRLASRLDDHLRRLVLASAARQYGDLAAAERAYSWLTRDYPDDAEGWFGLGESLFHLNPLHGRPATEAREAFVKAVALDPRYVEAFVHLARIDAMRGDAAEAHRWLELATEQMDEHIVERLVLHVRGLGGVSSCGSVDRQRLQRASAVLGGPFSPDVLDGTDPQTTEDYAAQFSDRLVPADIAAFGHRLIAFSNSACGQYSEAFGQLDRGRAADAVADVEARSLIIAGADVPFTPAVLEQARADVEQWQTCTPRDRQPSPDTSARSREHDLLRLHRLGLLALRGGDTAAAVSALNELLAAPVPDSGTAATAHALVRSLRAHIAAAAGDSARALALLEEIRWPPSNRLAAVEPLDRLLHADLLAATGRRREALRWYATLVTGAPQELPLMGFAVLGMARTNDRLGERDAALREYRRLVALWRQADAPLQPTVTAAERRIAQLTRTR